MPITSNKQAILAYSKPEPTPEAEWTVTTDNTGTLSGVNVLWLADTNAARNRTLDTDGVRLHVKDTTGTAETYNITLTAGSGHTINGNATETIDINFGWVEYVRSGTNWVTIAGQGYADPSPDLTTPASLFTDGQGGVWYDINDLTTVFTDLDGTSQAVVGNPVALVRDKSGNGRDMYQPAIANRPLLQVDGNGNYYLDFDGINDIMTTYETIPAYGNSRAFVCAGFQRDTRKVFGVVAETSYMSPQKDGSLTLIGNPSGADSVYASLRGNSTYEVVTSLTYANPFKAVVSVTYSVARALTQVPQMTMRINTGLVTLNTFLGAESYDITHGNQAQFNSHILCIGSRLADVGTLAFDGRIYQLVLRYGDISQEEIDFVEAYVNSQMNAY